MKICPLCGGTYVLWTPSRCWNCGWKLRRSSSAQSGGCVGMIQGIIGIIILLWLATVLLHAH